MYDSWSHDKTLDVYRKMTPKRSGKWKELVAVTNPDEADFHVIVDYTTKHKFDPKKAIYISAHPKGCPGHYEPEEYLARIDYSTTSGFIEWYVDYDYDELSNMDCPNKTNFLACIMTTSNGRDYQKDRIAYIDDFLTYFPNMVDMYGKGRNPVENKDFLIYYRYCLEFDAYGENYFSERVADALLMYCMPWYKGGTGLEKFIPEESFGYIGNKAPQELLWAIQQKPINIGAIKEARYNILNKLQVWAKVYDTIKAL